MDSYLWEFLAHEFAAEVLLMCSNKILLVRYLCWKLNNSFILHLDKFTSLALHLLTSCGGDVWNGSWLAMADESTHHPPMTKLKWVKWRIDMRDPHEIAWQTIKGRSVNGNFKMQFNVTCPHRQFQTLLSCVFISSSFSKHLFTVCKLVIKE